MRTIGDGEDAVLLRLVLRQAKEDQGESEPLPSVTQPRRGLLREPGRFTLAPPGPSSLELKLDPDDPTAQFVRYGFAHPLRLNSWGGPAYGRAATVLTVGTGAAGLLSTVVVAAGGANDLFIALLGLCVGVLTAVSQVWKPGRRSVARYQAAHALRREGWSYVHRRGRYIGLTGSVAFTTFLDEVMDLQRQVEAIDEDVGDATTIAARA